MGSAEVEEFLTHLAVAQRVSAATQNQAMHASLFLYRQVLDMDLPWLENITRASKPKRLPVVLSRKEVRAVLAELDGVSWLIASLLYGGGLRLTEALRLRVNDLHLECGEIVVRGGKGGKDRMTVLPAALIVPLRAHLSKLNSRFQRERRAGEPGVSLPMAVVHKYPSRATLWGWH
jgi:integrase